MNDLDTLSWLAEQTDIRSLRAAVCDLKADRLDKAASAAAKDNPFTTKEWRKVIERKDVDAVFVATPPHLHSEMAVAALEAGKHVYCEKPVGVTPQQVRAVVRAAKKSKKVFVAGQQMRTMVQLGMVGVLTTQLWHHTFIESLADLPSAWAPPRDPTPPGAGRAGSTAAQATGRP